MSLSVKLWDRMMDRILEAATGHQFDPSTLLPSGGRCVKCGAHCLDVMDDYKDGKAEPCPSKQDNQP